jgi:hypothetical protein
LPIEGPFEDLLAVSEELYDNEVLLANSRRRVDELLKVIGDAEPGSCRRGRRGLRDFHVKSFAQPFDPNVFCAQYLARVYRLVNRRFHLDDWDASILRKLDTLESIYKKISDQASNRPHGNLGMGDRLIDCLFNRARSHPLAEKF